MVISLFHGTRSDYVQVVCLQDRYHDKMAEMGWVKDPELLPESDNYEVEIEESADNAAKESEEQDSLIDELKALDSKSDIEKLIKDHFGVDIDKRGSLETVKEKALQIIIVSRLTAEE